MSLLNKLYEWNDKTCGILNMGSLGFMTVISYECQGLSNVPRSILQADFLRPGGILGVGYRVRETDHSTSYLQYQ